MPAGLQVFDPTTAPVVELTSRLGRVLGIVRVTTASGSLFASGFTQGTPFAFAASEALTVGSNPWAFTPEVTISGTTLSWDFGSKAVHPTHIIYGVY